MANSTKSLVQGLGVHNERILPGAAAEIKAAGGFCLSSKFRHSNTRDVDFSANDVYFAPDSRPWRTIIGTAAFDPSRILVGVREHCDLVSVKCGHSSP